MAKHKLILLILLVATALAMHAQTSAFDVYFVQGGKQIDVSNNKVTLENKPFDIMVVMPKDSVVFVNASFEDASYKKALKGAAFNEIPGFEELGMAESLNNADNDILLDNKAPMYWYYDSPEDCRFNKVEVNGNIATCTRSVSKLYLVGRISGNGLDIALDKVKEPLYLVFASRGYIFSTNDFKKQVKITWK